MAGLDAVAEQVEDVGLLERSRRKDARATCVAGDLCHCQPFAARQWGGGVEPEAASADRLPMLAARIAPSRQAVGEGQGEGLA